MLHKLSSFTNRPACVDEIAVATSMDASALLNIQAIYHDPKRAEWTTYEYIAYHILITWYAGSSKTQTEKLCKLREIYYAMGYAKNFDMYLADSRFELPRMKKGDKAKQTPSMGVSVQERQNSFSPSSQISLGPNGENVGKRILDICCAHRNGESSQGGTRHSLPPARRQGGFNFNDQLNSSTER